MIKTSLLILSLCLLLGRPALAQNQATQAAFDNAVDAFWGAAPDLDALLADFSAIIAQAPQFAEAYAYRAAVQRLLGATDSAIADVEAALRLDAGNALVLATQARLLADAGRPAEALIVAEQAIQNDPTLAVAHYYLARLRTDPAQSLRDASQAIALEARPFFYYYRATLQDALGAPQAALDDLEIAIAQAPDLAEAYILAGRLYRDLGQFQQGRAVLSRAIERGLRTPELHLQRSLTALRQHQIPTALADLDAALLLDPAYFDALLMRAQVYSYMSLYALAIADYTAALALDDPQANDGAPYYYRGVAHLRSGDTAAAEADFARARALGFEG